MDEDSKYFWIIPITALIVGVSIGAGTIEYKINTIGPNAAIELDEINSMSCNEIKKRNSLGSYWTPENGKHARDKVESCLEHEDALKELERQRMGKLLSDPNSRESLIKKLKELSNTNQKIIPEYNEYAGKTLILKGNLTDIESQTNTITQKMIDLGYVENKNGCYRFDFDDDSAITVCD